MTDLVLKGVHAQAGGTPILDDLSLRLAPGRILVVLGASGAGKTTLGLAAAGGCRPGVRLSGTIDGPAAAHLPQHPAAVLDPARRCGAVLTELAGIEHPHRAARRAAAEAALLAAGLDAVHGRRFPHQLSGGQQQRMALAMALATGRRFLVLDEPTTGLHPQSRAALVDRLRALAVGGIGQLVLTHDRVLARAVADETFTLEAGKLVPAMATDDTLPPRTVRAAATTFLEFRDVTVHRGQNTVLSDVAFSIDEGSRTALIGPSGAGKTTLARTIAGLVRPAHGAVLLDGLPLPPAHRRTTAQLRAVQYVHQDAAASFAEHRPVLTQVATTAVRLRGLTRGAATVEAADILRRMGIPDAHRLPGTLSGGQIRRCALARALLARPRLLIVDELTAGLDPATRTTVLTLLDAEPPALLLIGHDHPELEAATDRTLVLDGGRLTELE
ncbi:ABC transporter ATP-binding protein [Amycolatopsis ultiminotia]|uniref:ABC transporter ATP-binding protein n=1 Tax=Amycolatopsis ultiminotia TaxID=543629 RepID=A0ABP6UY30_9PSEU